MDLTKTSHLKSSSSSERGFTLIEVMVVVGIIAAIIGLGIPRLNRNQNNLKKVTRELSVLGKEIRNQARLKGNTYRLVFKIENESSSYWVEFAPGRVVAENTADDDKLNDDEKKEKAKRSQFQRAEKFGKKDKQLPGNLIFRSIETNSNPEPIRKGQAQIYFSPEGLIEKAVIQLGNSKNETTWSLIYNPLTGHADIVEKAISLKDIEEK